MSVLLAMSNPRGVVASLLATDDADDRAITRLRFRIVSPGEAPREEDFGGEPKARNEPEILDLIDGLRTLLETQGFTEERLHAQ